MTMLMHRQYNEWPKDSKKMEEGAKDEEGSLLRAGGVVINGANQGNMRRPKSGSIQLDVDKMLSDKLNNMTLEERTEGIHELHGVADGVAETPEMLQQKLDEMTQIANTLLPEESTQAYQLALEMNKDYVQGIKRLCLRADRYDTQNAASRMAAFFRVKRLIFEDDQLAREITLEDFQGDDLDGLNRAPFQLLQERDRAGRAIIMFVGSVAAEISVKTNLRVFHFVFMNALRDLEIQKRGVVLILYTIGQERFHSDRPAKLAQSLQSIPMRVVAVHFCYERKLMDLAVNFFCQQIESRLLCRFRGHCGSYLEWIPFDGDLQYHLRYQSLVNTLAALFWEPTQRPHWKGINYINFVGKEQSKTDNEPLEKFRLFRIVIEDITGQSP